LTDNGKHDTLKPQKQPKEEINMRFKTAQQRHIENQIEFKEALAEMTAYYDEFSSCVKGLKEQSKKLDREIMGLLDAGEEHEAKMKCLEMSLVEKQYESMSTYQFKLFEVLFNLRQTEMLNNLSHITSRVKRFLNVTPDNMLDLVNLTANNKAQKYLDTLCRDLSVNSSAANSLFNRYKERYTRDHEAGNVTISPIDSVNRNTTRASA
jgi:hypothetical protein